MSTYAIDAQQITTFEVRVEYEVPKSLSFAFNSWEIHTSFVVQINTCHVEKHSSKVILLLRPTESRIDWLFVTVKVPKGARTFLVSILVRFISLLLHFSVLVECILHGKQAIGQTRPDLFVFGV